MVLNWNGWTDTIECLESLAREADGDAQIQIVVVDNASSDDSVDQLENWIQAHTNGGPAATLLRSSANRGFSSGNNQGIRFALAQTTCEFIWLLNNDTKVQSGALSALLLCAEQKEAVGIFGSTVVDYQTGRIQCAGGARYNPITTQNVPALAGKRVEEVLVNPPRINLDYIFGASMFLRSAAVKRAGPLDEDFFLYFEELEYARRLESLGYELAWCPSSVVLHKGGAAAGSRSSRRPGKSSLAEFHSNRSAILYTRKAAPHLFLVVFVVRFFLKLVHFFRYGEWRLFPAMVRGLAAGARASS